MKSENQKSKTYSISEAAEMLCVSIQTLRYYEERGLIIIMKSPGNQRVYARDDLKRIRCIQKAVNKEKISIEGIRRIHALIPCWAIISCLRRTRNACPAYKNHDAGCWTYKKKLNEKTKQVCRRCTVYRLSSDCKNIKNMIRRFPNLLEKQYESVSS